MNWRILTAGLAVTGALAAAGFALAQGVWPTVTKADLAACRPIFAQVKQAEIAFIQSDIDRYCQRNSQHFDDQNCQSMRTWMAESRGEDPLDWFFKGNDRCEGGDYPCFGPALYNDPRTGEDARYWIANFEQSAASTRTITLGMDLWEAAGIGDSCIARVWVQKYRGTTASAPITPAPTAVAAPSSGKNRFDPHMRRITPPPLSPQQAQACEADVRALQAGSADWRGTLDEISLKIAMAQRTLYATRCAGHASAESILASADRIIADTGPRAARVETLPEDMQTVATDCLEPVPHGAIAEASDSSVFRNSCAYPVAAMFCNVAPNAGTWAAMFACEAPGASGFVTVPANGVTPVVFGRQVNHFACRQPALPVASYTPDSGLSGFCK